MALFLLLKWTNNKMKIGFQKSENSRIPTKYITSILFCSNFIGIVFSRSLHYQFYVWYYHTLPHLLWLSPYPNIIRIILFFLIEIMWNIFPSNPYSSLTLFICHIIIMIGLWRSEFWQTWDAKDE